MKEIFENGKLSVGIVDDDVDMIHFVKRELSRSCETSLYTWKDNIGYYGIREYLESEDIDLLILDINLPGISGFEIGKQFREARGVEVPIIYISADTSVDKYIRWDQRNTYFMTKPFKKEEIADVVQKMAKLI